MEEEMDLVMGELQIILKRKQSIGGWKLGDDGKILSYFWWRFASTSNG